MLTAGTFLMYKETTGSYTPSTDSKEEGKFAILANVSEYPDLDSEMDNVDNTTLSDAQHTYEPGLPDSGGSWAFPGYFNKDDYDRVQKLDGKVLRVGVWFGGNTSDDGVTITPTGDIMQRYINARVKVRITGAAVGDVRPVEYDVYPTTDKADYPATA